MFPSDHPAVRAALIGAGLLFMLAARQAAGYSRAQNDRHGQRAMTLAALGGAAIAVAIAPW